MIILRWIFANLLLIIFSITTGWYFAKCKRLEKENRQLSQNVMFNPQDYKKFSKELLDKE